MTAGEELKPHCPRCGVWLILQIRGVDHEHSQYKCPNCQKVYLGMNVAWEEGCDAHNCR